MHMLDKFLFFLIVALGITSTQAQLNFIRMEPEFGYTWAHHSFLEGITGTLTHAVAIQYARISPGQYWSQIWNHPETGIEAVWYDFNQKHLGQAFALFYFADFRLNNRKQKGQWFFRTSAGFGYITRPYNKVTNPENVIFGSHFSSTFAFAFYYRYKFSLWNAGLGIGIRHFSNGNYQSPNNGINCPSLFLHLSFPLKNDTAQFIKNSRKIHFKPKRHWQIFLRAGINETDIPGMGKFPFFIPGIQYLRQPTYKHTWGTGIELMMNYSVKELLHYENIAYSTYPSGEPDFKRIGWFLSHRFMFGKTSLNQALGLYLYNPSKKESFWYSRLGVEYRIFDRWSVSYSVKLHYFMAEELEWGISFRL